MKLLLTGATGFVGRNLLLHAINQGVEVFAPVRDERKLSRQLEAEGVDSSKVRALPANPREWSVEYDALVHCAGVLFERSLDRYLETNVYWTNEILKTRYPGCPTVILSSQSAGGPTPEGQLSREESNPDDPRSLYGESKLRMERLILREQEGEPIALLRPPMILGPRDNATLQLFKLAASPLRPKPGMRAKHYSFIAVSDLVEAIETALFHAAKLNEGALYVASRQTISDIELIKSAAAVTRKPGLTIPLPDPVVKVVSGLVDKSPKLRSQLPSLTRDRVEELWPSRWVVNPGAFESATGWFATTSAAEALKQAYDFARTEGTL